MDYALAPNDRWLLPGLRKRSIVDCFSQLCKTVNAAGVPRKFQKIDLAAEMRRTIATAIGRNL